MKRSFGSTFDFGTQIESTEITASVFVIEYGSEVALTAHSEGFGPNEKVISPPLKISV
ncbi:MAG: hypothetical protein IPF54_03105 [Draconibacterium sp.]|nr:hypothetical protein [Draconibacterium sp.]